MPEHEITSYQLSQLGPMVCHHELADPDDDTVHSMLRELLGYLDRNATCMCIDELDFL